MKHWQKEPACFMIWVKQLIMKSREAMLKLAKNLGSSIKNMRLLSIRLLLTTAMKRRLPSLLFWLLQPMHYQLPDLEREVKHWKTISNVSKNWKKFRNPSQVLRSHSLFRLEEKLESWLSLMRSMILIQFESHAIFVNKSKASLIIQDILK